MNYHVEHHVFPMVPFYNLPRLHKMIKSECPPACQGSVGVLWGNNSRRPATGERPELVRPPSAANARRAGRVTIPFAKRPTEAETMSSVDIEDWIVAGNAKDIEEEECYPLRLRW
jgi:Fatty acid desaturase